MIGIAREMARATWAALLWWLRRPAVRWARRNWVRLLPARFRERALRSLYAHDRFARRYGVASLTAMFTLLLGSVLLSLAALFVTYLYESGALTELQMAARESNLDQSPR